MSTNSLVSNQNVLVSQCFLEDASTLKHITFTYSIVIDLKLQERVTGIFIITNWEMILEASFLATDADCMRI